jgi:hypothetical protein
MSEPSLLAIQPTPFVQPQGIYYLLQLCCTTPKPGLPKSDSILFIAGLFSCMLLDTIPATVQLYCLQPQCRYTPKPQCLDYTITSNYWTYYKYTYPQIAVLYNSNTQKELSSQSSSHASNVIALFTLQLSNSNTTATEAFCYNLTLIGGLRLGMYVIHREPPREVLVDHVTDLRGSWEDKIHEDPSFYINR